VNCAKTKRILCFFTRINRTYTQIDMLCIPNPSHLTVPPRDLTPVHTHTHLYVGQAYVHTLTNVCNRHKKRCPTTAPFNRLNQYKWQSLKWNHRLNSS